MSSSSTITRVPSTGHDYANFVSPLPHPGEHLREDYLPQYELSVEMVAAAMDLDDPGLLQEVIAEERDLDPDLALRLGKVFQTTPDMWLALQAGHDLSKAAITSRRAMERVRPLVPVAA